jgi:hypothetical protein
MNRTKPSIPLNPMSQMYYGYGYGYGHDLVYRGITYASAAGQVALPSSSMAAVALGAIIALVGGLW